MVMLKGYNQFAGRHWETGSIRNALAYQGVKAPHTGEAVSEALLMGLSGGAAFGYFTFEYQGYPPHIALLTRNTFDPFQTLLNRLAVPQEVAQTKTAAKGEANLIEALESGHAPIVWADMFTLPYNDYPADSGYWGMMPVIVYGIENDTAYLADRSACALEIPAETLTAARARVKQDKFRVMTLGEPDWKRLPEMVKDAIRQCASLFDDVPPKGTRDNFGLTGLLHWADMLTNTRNKNSWARYFEPGLRMWMALVGDEVQTGAYGFIARQGGNSAERGMFADFLEEAAVILNKTVIKEAADLFRESEKTWRVLANKLLPDEVPTLKEAKTLLDRKESLFIERGASALDEIRAAKNRLRALREGASADFPISGDAVTAYRAGLAAQVLKIHDLERDAVRAMRAAFNP